MKIELENIRRGPQYENDQSIATFDVRVGQSFYIDIRLLRNKNKHFFISYPQKKRTDLSGKPHYVRSYDWGKEKNDQFDKELMQALKDKAII